MVSCNLNTQCGLATIKANASIQFGSDTLIKTPDIINISITKSRGNLVSTAQAQFHFNSGDLSGSAGSDIVIKILDTLAFTGTIKRIDISPSFRCAGEQIVRIQAEDYLNKIVNRTITRRQKLPGLGPIAFISSIYKRTTVGFDSARDLHDINQTNSPVDIFTHTINFAEMTQFSKSGENNLMGTLHPVTKVADVIVNGGGNGGGGLGLHSHEKLDLSERGGGMAYSVFGIK